MDLIKKSYPIHLVLRAIAPVFGLMPKTVINLRNYYKRKRFTDWNHPQDLYDYALVKMFEAKDNGKALEVYADLADKVKVREFVSERVGAKYLTKLYGVWEDPKDIDFEKLPVPCVIKTNNGCTTNIIIRDRKDLKPDEIRKKLDLWLKYPYGKLTGQPHYTLIKPLILAEEFLDQNPGTDDLPFDYKFFCFKGKPHFILFYSGRTMNSHVTRDHVYDTQWQLVDGVVRNPIDTPVAKPEAFEEMLEVATKLSQGFDFVRVDLYCIGNRVVFGEMTFTPDMVTNFTPEFLQSYLAKVQE